LELPLETRRENTGAVIQLRLQVAEEKKERDWAKAMLVKYHYMHRPWHPKSDPFIYLVKRKRDDASVGCILFNRMQCSRLCDSDGTLWCGRLDEKIAGLCAYTQWELITLGRFWLSPLVQQPYPQGQLAAVPCGPVPQFLFAPEEPLSEPVHHAASQIILEALDNVVYDYLLRYPPPFPDEPWRLRQAVSYCDTRLFNCGIYQASRFRAIRENTQGLRTYTHSLRDLTPQEEETILAASKTNQRCRTRRAARQFAKTMRQPAILKGRQRVWAEVGQVPVCSVGKGALLAA
jgi:hypothetical protein